MKALSPLLSLTLPLATASWTAELFARQAQSTCLTYFTVESATGPLVTGQPIAVQTAVNSNTVISLDPYNANVTVSNAPTALDTTITAYSTISRTVVRTYVTVATDYDGSTVSTSTATPSGNPSGGVQTEYIFTPRRYTTVTSTYAGATTSTVTQAPAGPGQTGTVVVQVPAYNTVTSTGGTVTYTSTVATNVNGVASSVVVVGVPTLNTITSTAGTVAYTSTVATNVNGVASSVVVVGVPAPPLNTVTRTVGTAGYTSTLPTTVNGVTSSVVVVGVPAPPLNTVTSTAGTAAYTSTLPTTVNGVASSVVVIGVPAPPLNTVTSTAGTAGYTSTLPTTVNGVASSVVVVGVAAPPLNTVTTTSGAVAYTSTVATAVNGVSSSVVVVGVPAPTCTATGLAYAAYTNPYTGGGTPSTPYFAAFNASYFNGDAGTALFSGVTTPDINFNNAAGGTFTLYGASRNLNQTAIVYNGYFRVPTTGTYTINFPAINTASSTDDVAYVWMGPAAQAGTWGEANFNIRSTYSIARGSPISQNFVAGQLYPIVVLYGNAPGGAVMQLTITPPTGSTLVSTAGYLFQPSCLTSGNAIAAAQPTNPVCAASGLEYIDRPAPTTVAGLLGLPASTTTFDPDNYNPPTATPYSTIRFRGVTDNIQLSVASPGTAVQVYGYGPYDVTQSAIFLRGYFVPNITGTWTFALNQPDDVGYFWWGQKSVSTWTQTNADISTGVSGSGSFTPSTPLVAGTIYPMRLAFGNGGGAMSYTLQTTDPAGTIRQSTNGFLRQRYCGTLTGWT